MSRNIGIYSGTFDPIHPGHIAFAEEAMRACELDEVVFLPEQNPRGKDGVTDMVHRVALIERATAAIAGLRVVQLASEQFTVQQTLPELRQAFKGSHMTFLVGSDVARTFLYRWEGLDVLLREAALAIGLRSSDSPGEIGAIMRQISQDYSVAVDYTLVSTPEAGMASSHIRNGTADMSRLHPSMLEYIQEHQLYARA